MLVCVWATKTTWLSYGDTQFYGVVRLGTKTTWSVLKIKIMNIRSSQKYRVALINVETQSWTVVTCLAAFMSVTALSILLPAVTVRSTTCHMNEIWRSSWCEAADTYKCEFFCDFQKLHCWCFHPADRPSSSLNSSLRRFVALSS